MSDWIKCSERMPERGDRYLVIDDGWIDEYVLAESCKPPRPTVERSESL